MLAAHFAVSVDRSQSSYSEETESSFVDETGSEDIADGPRIDAPQETEESLIDQINRWLDHDEFFGTGYRITAELSQFVAVASSEKSGPDGLERGKSDIRDRMVTFTLVDDAGRKLEFRDVGTGFSQVLPVIICCAVHESITILEQPELHLHPRLQTKLLDLFLESINKSRRALALTQIGNSESSYADALLLADRRKSLIVESHSEHIILRLMRRIRESSSADIKHTRLHVKPSDVAVIYFEPEGDETYVHLLELTDDGAFADRWPHGFFDERFEEFFDE
jgi:predicted ATPase